MKNLLAMAGLVVSLLFPANNQVLGQTSASQGVNVSITVLPVAKLTFIDESVIDIVLSPGQTVTKEIRVKVWANCSWILYVSNPTTVFIQTKDGQTLSIVPTYTSETLSEDVKTIDSPLPLSFEPSLVAGGDYNAGSGGVIIILKYYLTCPNDLGPVRYYTNLNFILESISSP